MQHTDTKRHWQSYGIVGIIALIGAMIARWHFFPLKTMAHWDEIKRYLYPGVDQHQYTMTQIFSALTAAPDNGQLIVFFVRIFRNLFPNNHDMAILAYKITLVIVSAGVVVWFVRKLFDRTHVSAAVWVAIAFLLAPMTWIQANEVMVETAMFPLLLLWVGAVVEVLPWHNLSRRQQMIASGRLFVLALLLFMTSIQYFLYAVMISTATLIIHDVIAHRSLREGCKQAVAVSILFVLITVAAISGWILLHWQWPFFQSLYYILRLPGVALQEWGFSALQMSTYDIYMFGLRNFAWLYFPAVLLAWLAAGRLLIHFPTLSRSAQFAVLFAVTGSGIATIAFHGNLQARYQHLANSVLLLILAYGLWHLFHGWWQWRRVKILCLICVIAYGVGEYYPLYRALPSLANMQAYGVYTDDAADADRASTLFGALDRRTIVQFPQLRYDYYYPNQHHARTPHVSQVIEKISDALQLGIAPVVIDEVIHYSQQDAQLQYLKKFGAYPPPLIEGQPALYVVVAFPPQSPYNSVYYAKWGGDTHDAAMAMWDEGVGSRSHQTVYTEETPTYTVRVALAPYVRPTQDRIDWSNFEEIRQAALRRIENSSSYKSDDMGWKGRALTWLLTR